MMAVRRQSGAVWIQYSWFLLLLAAVEITGNGQIISLV